MTDALLRELVDQVTIANGLLCAYLEEMRGLRAELAARRSPGHADAFHEWLTGVMPQLARAPSFTAKSAIARASKDCPFLAQFDRDHGAMALGHQFARAARERIVIDGRVIVRRGKDRGGGVYAVRTLRTSDEQSLIGRTAGFAREVRKIVA